MKCIRCDIELTSNDDILTNGDEFAHDMCIGIDDLNEEWIEHKAKGVINMSEEMKSILNDIIKDYESEIGRELSHLERESFTKGFTKGIDFSENTGSYI